MKKQATSSQIFIISGPSRVGKDAVTRALVRKRNLNLKRVITATSRPKRSSEIEGRDYYFLSEADFKKRIHDGCFLEWAVLRGGQYFGTPLSEFDRIKQQGKNVVLAIDVQGASQVKKMFPDAVRIFIAPDKIENLKKRMERAHFSTEEIEGRLQDMVRELKEKDKYDYVVVNEEGRLKETVLDVEKIVRKEILNIKY